MNGFPLTTIYCGGNFWSYQEHKTASDIKKIRELNLKGEWDQAEELYATKDTCFRQRNLS